MGKPLTSVLVPTDFSAGAQQALERALQLPLHPKAKVTLLHVIPANIPGRLRDEALNEAEGALQLSLKKVRALVARRTLDPERLIGVVSEGSAASVIVKRARALEADLVVLGRHGRRRVVDLFVGTTAQKVLRTGDFPVLVVHPRVKEPYRKPLVAVGLDQAALPVVRSASRIAGDQLTYTLFHASRVHFEDFVTLTGRAQEAYREQADSEAAQALKALAKRLTGMDLVTRVRHGDPRALILEEATSSQADLLVVGTHRSGARLVLLGNVAEWVLAHATCDVLVVRT